jgi:hypothetical protein
MITEEDDALPQVSYRSPRWNRYGTIDVELEHPVYGWIEFTATPYDEVAFGRLLYAEIVGSGVLIEGDPNPDLNQVALEDWRHSTRVSAFQAKAMLLQAGYWDDVAAFMADADPVTRLAWETAQEFERLSPTILELAEALGISDTELDDLFKFASTIRA